jgi:hypothetical protein
MVLTPDRAIVTAPLASLIVQPAGAASAGAEQVAASTANKVRRMNSSPGQVTIFPNSAAHGGDSV